MSNIEQIKRTVESLLYNKAPAHDFQHILRGIQKC